jgi:cell surface protein SprA
VSINEAFSPLLGVDVTFNNNLTCKVEYRTTRVLNLSMTSVQINESNSKDWVIGMGYKISDFNFFGLGGSRKVKGSKKKSADDDKNQQQNNRKTGINHDLNTRVDVSFRKQAAITRDIALVCERSLPVATLEKAILSVNNKLIQSVNLFDVYEGNQIDADKKSVAYSIVLQSDDKTLTDDDCNAVMKKIFKALEQVGAVLRS